MGHMAHWPEDQAEAAIAEYIHAGPEAIAWLEAQVKQQLEGSDGLATAWQWTVATILEGTDVDMAKLRFAITHLYARELQRRVPQSRWARYDDPLKAKLIGYNAPAIRVGDDQIIPGQVCINMIGRVQLYARGELSAGDEDVLERQKLNDMIDLFR